MIPRNPGDIGSLALALFHKWVPSKVFMIVTAYMDESGTHAGAPNMVVGGYVGRLGQWYHLERKFGALLTKNGLTYHHTKELIHREGEYKGWCRNREDKYIKRAAKIIRENTLCGFIATLKHEDYQKFYLSDHRPKRIPLDSKYGVCFRIILSFLPTMVQKSFGDNEVEMHMVLEAGATGVGFGDTERIFHLFKKDAPREMARIVKTRTVGDKKDSRGLQIADLAAYGAFHAEQCDAGLTYYPPGSTIDDVTNLVQCRSPVFRLPATPAVLQELMDNIISRVGSRDKLQK
jgi:hypothetical protein